jgi:hypothetical protein
MEYLLTAALLLVASTLATVALLLAVATALALAATETRNDHVEEVLVRYHPSSQEQHAGYSRWTVFTPTDQSRTFRRA